jgi:3-oxoacyl-[acyl-carrier protein] reductase
MSVNGRLTGKSTIVTGAGKGIGAAIAKRFALEGADVLVNYNSSKKQAVEVADSLKEGNKVRGKIIPFKADVAIARDRKALVTKALEEFGKIDVLVNNAGILISKNFLDVKEKDFDRVIGVNLKGVFFLCQEVAPVMQRQKEGKIINISSVSALAERSGLTYVDYVSSKAGVIGLTRSLAVNLGPSIKVNAICPGTIETDIISWMPQKIKDSMAKESVLNRLGQPEDIANVALFLASDESNFMTGEIVTVAGGRGMR